MTWAAGTTYAFAPGATFGQWLSALSRLPPSRPRADSRQSQRLVQPTRITIESEAGFNQDNRLPAYSTM